MAYNLSTAQRVEHGQPDSATAATTTQSLGHHYLDTGEDHV